MIGVVVTTLFFVAERRPARAPLVFSAIGAGFVVTILAVGILTTPIRPLLPWWSIVVANLLATLAAGRYLLRRHPMWRTAPPTRGAVLP